ncbi:hypothetical protein FJTKL_08258 [Diaporthe vaccinii]|uniref:Uncharacterized protein n=1 Tax=Diaporthe vaccinii TaxID=105482 RepID=A0ABR4ESN6_9PEZI
MKYSTCPLAPVGLSKPGYNSNPALFTSYQEVSPASCHFFFCSQTQLSHRRIPSCLSRMQSLSLRTSHSQTPGRSNPARTSQSLFAFGLCHSTCMHAGPCGGLSRL